jgi:hypothetical protein
MAAGRRAVVMTPVAVLAADHQGGSGSAVGRIALVVVAVLAVGAVGGMTLRTGGRCRRLIGPKAGTTRRRWATKNDAGLTGDTGTLLATIRTPCMTPPGRRGPLMATRCATRDLKPVPGQEPGGLPKLDSACLRYSYR